MAIKSILFLTLLMLCTPELWARGAKVIYGKTMCDEAVESYLLEQYPFQASVRKEVMQEYKRLIMTYLAPTDWKSPQGIDDPSNRAVAKDRRYFINNLFSFGANTKIGPVAKEAFLLLPIDRYRTLSFETTNRTFFSFVHYISFNNYQYFFCSNQRVYASLRKTMVEVSSVDQLLKNMQKDGYRILSHLVDESGLSTALVQRNGNYYYFKIMGNEFYQFSFDPSFADQNQNRLTYGLTK